MLLNCNFAKLVNFQDFVNMIRGFVDTVYLAMLLECIFKGSHDFDFF